ncbi:eukaryotic translation initiation factor 5A-like [Lineus longissimus]|uniref:eukaryotic translation initiation factor 5A-like n=1 Tax=Lineus longissimus TaxID=88925 RepID=UPI002B4E5719
MVRTRSTQHKMVKKPADVMEEETFQNVGAHSTNTESKQASGIRKSGYCMLRKGQFPCKVMDVSTSKTGKHGSAKVHVTGVDIFTGQKYEELFMSSKDVECPKITRHDYTAIMFREADDFYDYGTIAVLNDQNLVIRLRVEKSNKSYQNLLDADFENKCYSVKTIKFGDQEKLESIKEE